MIVPADDNLSYDEKDSKEAAELMDILENTILPMYYNDQKKWISIVKQAAKDIVPEFDSGRMADEYYQKMYLA